MTLSNQNRRQFIGSLAVSTAAAPMVLGGRARADAHGGDDFSFEITRTEEEWRAVLSDWEYRIMRESATEPHFTSEYWNEERPGHYNCQGCDLRLYEAEHKTVRVIGWVFFYHSVPNSVLTGIDEIPAEYGRSEGMNAEATMPETMIEVHCRRCGSHLGHIINVQSDILHCINGAALAFNPTEA